MPRFAPIRLLVLVCVLAACNSFGVENATPTVPNTDPTYQQLRNISLGSEVISVSNITLRRDAATFQLNSGIFCFVTPVQGKVTGAVFVGDGSLTLAPPISVERSTLRLLTKSDEFHETFSHLVLRFTDTTYDELKKAGSSSSGGCDAGLLRDSQNEMRHNRELKYNLDARLLQDVDSPEAGGFFLAFIHGKRYDDKEIFALDPHGAPPLIIPVYPEEEELVTYNENKLGVWASFHLSSEYKAGTALGSQKNSPIHIERQELETKIEKNAELIGKATTTLVAQANGLRVAAFDLFPTLRVQSVTDSAGQALAFIQEDKKEDADFSVILPKPLARGDKYTLVITYSGKDAISSEGNGNYFPIARENWFPNNSAGEFGEYTNYQMTFHIPKGMKMAATGDLVSENNDGGQNTSVWKTAAPQTTAGFNFGKFKSEEAKLAKPEYLVQSYANQDPPGWVVSMQHAVDQDLPTQVHQMPGASMGNLSTTPLIKKALAEGQLSVPLYYEYFGAPLFQHLAITQQTSCSFGQSWPALVYIPMCYFFDTTVRHQLGMDWGDRGYWKIVTPHEVAHQWWGNTVGFNSYRDQWMSEGFAEMSASLYLQMVERNPQKFISFWDDERQLLLEKDAQGYRAIDAGPVTLGYRISNTRTGSGVTRRLIYPKGGYILHMIRMMMWDRRTGDQQFKAMMQDFVKTYSGRDATTEDFQAMVEKHMTPEMDLEGKHKMDWFFDEYVYGTALPNYKLDYSFEKNSDGDVVVGMKLTQSNVEDGFRMLVPIYLELADGRVANIGRARLMGNKTVEEKVPLKGLKDTPRKVLINYYDDVLSTAN